MVVVCLGLLFLTQKKKVNGCANMAVHDHYYVLRINPPHFLANMPSTKISLVNLKLYYIYF